VALKLMTTAGRQPGKRFLREAQLLSELQHPAIVRYVTHGVTEENILYLAMEWLDGIDLEEYLRQRLLSPAQAVSLAQRVAAGLAAAHHKGIVHRDIKPANLFLCGANVHHVKLLDFGIARDLHAAETLTAAGAVVGTPAYMSPEQARAALQLTPAIGRLLSLQSRQLCSASCCLRDLRQSARLPPTFRFPWSGSSHACTSAIPLRDRSMGARCSLCFRD
jgi:serine/threonine protein kinase